MPNAVKYSTTNQTGSIRSNNVAIGNNNIEYGPTAITNWYNGITPPSGKYVIYETLVSGSPRIYVPNDDVQLITLAKSKGSTTNTAAGAIQFFASQSGFSIANENYPNIVTSESALLLDASYVESYPTTGSIWYDISGNGKNGSLINGPTFNNAGYITFDATDDICTFPVGTFNSGSPQNGTYYFRIKYPPYPSVQNQLFNESGGGFNNGIVYYRNPITPANRYFFINYYNTPTGVNNIITPGPNGLLAGEWADTAFTFNSSGGWAIYKNGALVNSGTASNFLSWKRDGTGVPNIKCSSPDGAGSQQLFLYYNKQLSESEILQNYYGGPIVTNGLVFAVDAGNFVSYESGSTTTYSLTGSLSGSLVNGTGYNSVNGGTWVFDGVDDYISCNFPIGVGDFTFSVWMKKTTNVANLEFVMGRYVDQADRGAMLYFNGGTLRFRLGGSPSGQFVESNLGNVTDGTWKNIISSVTRTGNIVSYINGVPSVTTNASTQQGSIANGNFIGSLLGSSWFLGGNLTTIFIYNRALSATEVLQNFRAQSNRFI